MDIQSSNLLRRPDFYQSVARWCGIRNKARDLATRLGFRLALSYANEFEPDGAGAQLQRIAAIFGLSRLLGAGYIHSGVRDLSWNPSDQMPTRSARILEVRVLNELFEFQNRGTLPYSKVMTVEALTFLNLLKAIVVSWWTPEGLLLRIQNPHSVTNITPRVYDHASEAWSQNFYEHMDKLGKRPSRKRTVIHIRIAVNPKTNANGEPNPRYLSPDWYVKAMAILEKQGLSDHTHLFEIHTDLEVNRPLSVPQGALHNSKEYWVSLGVQGQDGKIHPPNDFDLNSLLAKLDRHEIVTNMPPSEVLKRMVQADVLVGAKSSLSFVAGLLRANRPTVFPKFWHPIPRTWISF